MLVNILRQSVRQYALCLLALIGAALALPAGAQVLPQTLLAEVLALARQAAASGAPAGARIEAAPGALDPRLQLAPCARSEAYLSAGTRPWGRTRVGLRCLQGATLWNVFVPVTVKVLAPALVGSSALPAGAVLEAAQLRTAEIDWAAEASPAQTRSELAVGRTLARPLAAGQALRSADLRPRQWFAAGDTVRIVASGNGFSVSGEGQAMSNGVEGQPARVRVEGGRVVSGQPSGERRIEVSL